MTRETKLEATIWVCLGGFLGTLLLPWFPLTPAILASFFSGMLVAFGKRLER